MNNDIRDPVIARLRVNWLGQVVVQVGISLYTNKTGQYETVFRDAKSYELPAALLLLSLAANKLSTDIIERNIQ